MLKIWNHSIDLLGAEGAKADDVIHADKLMLQHLTGCNPLGSIELKHRLQHVHEHQHICHLHNFVRIIVRTDDSGLKHEKIATTKVRGVFSHLQEWIKNPPEEFRVCFMYPSNTTSCSFSFTVNDLKKLTCRRSFRELNFTRLVSIGLIPVSLEYSPGDWTDSVVVSSDIQSTVNLDKQSDKTKYMLKCEKEEHLNPSGVSESQTFEFQSKCRTDRQSSGGTLSFQSLVEDLKSSSKKQLVLYPEMSRLSGGWPWVSTMYLIWR